MSDKNLAKEISEISSESLPNHVLIIPDGNGRWAKKFHKIPAFGHKKGFTVLKSVIRKLQGLPIDILTIWGFSADNWKRDSQETEALMKIFDGGIKEVLSELHEKKIRFIHIGRKDRIPKTLQKTISIAENETKKYGPKVLCIAIDYSGTDQEIRIMQQVLKLSKETKIDKNFLSKLRDGKGIIPPADLIIRTSGEQRTSDLGWLSINSEFYSIKKNLPDTKSDDFLEALLEYSKRERRFGARLK